MSKRRKRKHSQVVETERGTDFNVNLCERVDDVIVDLGWSPLMKAVAQNNMEYANKLLSESPEMAKHVSNDGNDVVNVAVRYEHVTSTVPIINKLAELGVDFNREFEGMTPLGYAAKECFPEVLSALIAGGADVNGVSGHPTPLMQTGVHGYKDNAKVLLEAGADKDAVSSDGWAYGEDENGLPILVKKELD